MYSKGSSNYFFNRSPERFGSQQADYILRTKESVTEAVDKINTALNSNKDLTQIFYDTIDYFGNIRHNIAREHGTSSAELYGIRRDSDSVSVSMMITSLGSVYSEYNVKLLAKVQNYLRSMKHNISAYQQTELKVPGRSSIGRHTSTDVSILTIEKKDDWSFISMTFSDYERICEICSIEPLDIKTHCLEECINHLFRTDCMRLIKQHSINDYKRLKMFFVMKDLYIQFPGKKSDWVLVTTRCEIQGKMYALTQYVTWMYRTLRDDPVEFMTTRSDPTVVTLIHQDVFLIKETLKEIANLFKQAINWDKANIHDLQNIVALISYLFAHAMPFKRGSAAISEWLEMAIYQYHGYELEYREDVSINMEALILHLDEFIDKYSSMIKLEPIDASELGARV